MYCFCPKPNPVYAQDMGEYVCTGCGFIFQFNVVSEEKQIEEPIISKKQTGNIPGSINGKYGKISTYAERMAAQVGNDRRFLLLRSHLNPMLDEIEAPAVIRAEAFDIANKISKRKILRSKHSKVICGAILLLVCHVYGRPVQFKFVLSMVDCKSHLLSRVYRAVKEHFPMEVTDSHERTKILIMQYSNNLDVKNYKNALGLLEILHESKFTEGKNPSVIASYVVYVCSNVTEDQIMTNNSITKVSLRKYVRTLRESDLIKNNQHLLVKL